VKGGPRRLDWAREAERLVAEAADGVDCDAARLEVLSRISLRLSAVSPQSGSTLLPILEDRLEVLDLSARKPEQRPEADRAPCDRTVEYLFRASLALPLPLSRAARGAVARLDKRVRALGGEVGEWARMERRRALWEDLGRGGNG